MTLIWAVDIIEVDIMEVDIGELDGVLVDGIMKGAVAELISEKKMKTLP